MAEPVSGQPQKSSFYITSIELVLHDVWVVEEDKLSMSTCMCECSGGSSFTMEDSSAVTTAVPAKTKGAKRQKRKSTEPSTKTGDQSDAGNKNFTGVRWRRYPYGMRFVPRVRVPKTRYELPLGEYRTLDEAALVRDVATFYYGKKGGFNFTNDYPASLPEIPSHISGQEKIEWVSARAKERARIMFPKPLASQPAETFVSNDSVVPTPLSVALPVSGTVQKTWPATHVMREMSEAQTHSDSIPPHSVFWNLVHHQH